MDYLKDNKLEMYKVSYISVSYYLSGIFNWDVLKFVVLVRIIVQYTFFENNLVNIIILY